MREFRRSEFYQALISSPFTLTEFIWYGEDEMDTAEKKAAQGYLKEYSYTEACERWWANMTEENKAIIMRMPNFDKKVFKDITGIEVVGEDKNE